MNQVKIILISIVTIMLLSRSIHAFTHTHRYTCSSSSSVSILQRLSASTSPSPSTSAKQPKEEKQRLERIISNRGIGSRNDVSKLFKQGRISIDGEVIRSGKDKYPLDVVVEVDGEISNGVPLLAIYHKPVGIHSVLSDPWGRETLETLSLDFPYLKTMHPVGRLDADTSGLLLFSSNGQLTNTLLNPSTGIEREYEAIVTGTVNKDELSTILSAGVKTTEGSFVAKLLDAYARNETVLLDSTYNIISDDDDATTPIPTPTSSSNDKVVVATSLVKLSVMEGKYRMVRRILHNCGHSVLHLHRVRYGDILLDSSLEEGEVRQCTDREKLWATRYKV